MTLYVVMFGTLYLRSYEQHRADFVLELQQAHLYTQREIAQAARDAKRVGGRIQELHIEFVR